MRSTPVFILVTILCLTASPAARTDPGSQEPDAWCGTHAAGLLVAHARHEYFERRAERRRAGGAIPLKSAPHVYQRGEIAVIEDDGTLASPTNPFDLQGRAVQYLRRPKGMSAVRSKLDFKQVLGTRLELGDNDSTLIEFPEGFRFPFGDEVYSEVYVNADGNLTFGERDRGFRFDFLANFINGPPRIAPLFTDLDPPAAEGEGGVYLNLLPGRFRVTYYRVPEKDAGNLNTVQVTLFTTGRVVFVYGARVDADRAVVGVAPPFADGALHLMDYNEELPFRPPRRVTIAEQFTEEPWVDDLAVATTFFQHFEDVHSHLIVWQAFFPESLLFPRGFAFELPTRNSVRGLGLQHIVGTETFDFTRWFGSPGRLESYVQMGTVRKYPDDPDLVFVGNGSAMNILAHEFGHRWLSFVHFRDAGGNVSTDLLRDDGVHWSFLLHAEGSVMEGSDFIDNGDGSYTTSDASVTRFGSLDRYLMGLLPPEAVPGFFYITDNAAFTPNTTTEPGKTVRGRRVDVSVDDVIAVEGPRRPASARTPQLFRTAFVLLGRQGQPIPEEIFDRLETFRQRWLSFLPEATDGLAEADTALVPK